MCGRYVSPDQAAIEREWHIGRHHSITHLLKPLEENYNAAPTVKAPIVRVVRDQDGGNQAGLMHWGLIAPWEKGIPGKYSTINARIETFRTAGSYRNAWKQGQRCLVPLKGFYEWQAQAPDYQRTVPFYISVADQDLFALAGLWEVSRKEDGTAVESFTVITMPANPLIAEIHNSKKAGAKRIVLPPGDRRMPAIVAKEDQDRWLRSSVDEAFAVLKQYPADLMLAVPVSARVNSVKNNGAELIQPVAIAQ